MCKSRMLKNGLLIGNSLVSSNKGIGTICIMNSDITNKFVNSVDLDLEPLTNYQIVNSVDEYTDEHTIILIE